MSSDHRYGRIISFFFHLIDQTLLYRWLYLNVFECIQWWPIINVVALIYGYSYLISLEIVVGYWKLRTKRNPGQFKCVLEKTDSTYPLRDSIYESGKLSGCISPGLLDRV